MDEDAVEAAIALRELIEDARRATKDLRQAVVDARAEVQSIAKGSARKALARHLEHAAQVLREAER